MPTLAEVEAEINRRKSAKGGSSFDEWVTRPLGRAGRSMAAGAASIIDAPRIITDPLAASVGQLTNAVGFPETGAEISSYARAPYVSNMVREAIDDETGGYLAPKNRLERNTDLASEIVSAMMTPAVASKAIGAIENAGSGITKGLGTVKRGAMARDAETLANEAAQGKIAAGGIRQQMQNVGAVISKKKSQELVKNLDDALKNVDLIPELSPKTSAIVQRIRDTAGGGIELNKLDQYRRLLRAASNEDTVAASAVRKAIDDTVGGLTGAADFSKGGYNAVRLLGKFRQEYTQAAKFDDIADVLIRADGDPNKIKAGLTRFLQKPENIKGFTSQEKALLKRAASLTTTEKITKALGKFGIDFGSRITPGNTVAPIIGGAVGGTPVVAGGTVARGAQKYLARGKAEDLLQAIEGAGVKSSAPPVSGNSVGAVSPVVGGGVIQERLQTEPANNNRQTAKIPAAGIGIQEIEREMQRRGIGKQSDADILRRIRGGESGGNPNAKNPNSSASGLYQITDGTFRRLAAKRGISFAQKNNPQVQELLAGDLLVENRRLLAKALGRTPDGNELILAHFSGAGNANRIINNPDRPAYLVVKRPPIGKRSKKTDPVLANMNVFFEGKRPRTGAELINYLAERV